MKKTEKKKIAGAGLYIVLAACVLSAMTINVVNNAKLKKIKDGEKTSVVDVKADGVTDDTQKVAKAEKSEKNDTARANPELAEKKLSEASQKASAKVTDIADTPTSTDLPDSNGKQAAADGKSYKTYVMPVSGNMGEFDNKAIVFSETMKDYRVHNGVDIEAAAGTNVLAFASGTVKSVYDDALMGKVVEIDHGDGLISVYKNLDDDIPSTVVAGASIAAGDVIGKVGTTALAESAQEPHLHFEVCFENESVDPKAYLTEGK